MTAQSCNRMMAMIKANYPHYHSKTDTETQKEAVRIMALILQDIDERVVDLALMHYMAQAHEFPPVAGQLRCIAQDLLSPFGSMRLENMPPAVRDFHEVICAKYTEIEQGVNVPALLDDLPY